MSKKQKFEEEYELRASPKMLYPYLNSASGLSVWFADDVKVTPDKVFLIEWEGEIHKAKITAQKLNSFVRLEFLPKPEDTDPSYIEFKIDTNDLTQTTFLKVADYSDMVDDEEFHDLWDFLVLKLKEIVGG
ncbi:MAG TPA: START-like domain-containing protein [Cytophagales bacterium]|nr:START-like domain-containing protein [Cytophagales bacterium]